MGLRLNYNNSQNTLSLKEAKAYAGLLLHEENLFAEVIEFCNCISGDQAQSLQDLLEDKSHAEQIEVIIDLKQETKRLMDLIESFSVKKNTSDQYIKLDEFNNFLINKEIELSHKKVKSIQQKDYKAVQSVLKRRRKPAIIVKEIDINAFKEENQYFLNNESAAQKTVIKHDDSAIHCLITDIKLLKHRIDKTKEKDGKLSQLLTKADLICRGKLPTECPIQLATDLTAEANRIKHKKSMADIAAKAMIIAGSLLMIAGILLPALTFGTLAPLGAALAGLGWKVIAGVIGGSFFAGTTFLGTGISLFDRKKSDVDHKAREIAHTIEGAFGTPAKISQPKRQL